MNVFWSRVARGTMVVALVGAPACASRAESEAVAATAAGVREDPPEVMHLNFIREALAKVSLGPEQKQKVDALAADATARHASIQSARVTLAGALADQVKGGAIDRATLKPQIDALVLAIEQTRPADRAALVSLHDLLDRTQRNQFVDALEAELHGRHPERRGLEMRQWAADLNLSDAQREQIHAAVRAKFDGQDGGKRPWREARERGRMLIESFRQDQFTIEAASAFSPERVEHRVGKMLDLVDAAVPILTPEQRAIAAQKIRSAHPAW